MQIDTPVEGLTPSRQFDISKIDFDLLRREFAKVKRKNLILKDLDDLIQQRLNELLFANPQRINYYERYQEIIEAYNSEQNRATIEKTFMDLMDLANSMDQEEQRYVREGFSSDEELSLYDLLFSENLSKQDIQKIKQVAVDLLAKVKAKIARSWITGPTSRRPRRLWITSFGTLCGRNCRSVMMKSVFQATGRKSMNTSIPVTLMWHNKAPHHAQPGRRKGPPRQRRAFVLS